MSNSRVFKPSERAEAEESGEVSAPPFPVECLPPVLREMAEGVATLQRVPASMTAPMVLATAAASLGRGVVLRTLRGKLTPPNLFVCVCKESGTGGSSAFKLATSPMDGMQARLLRDFRTAELPRLEAQKATLTIESEALKAAFRKAEGAERERCRKELESLLARIKATDEAMKSPLLWTSDSTPESLAEQLAANHDTLAQFNPDAGDSFSSMLGCYRDKSSRDGSHALWLKAFSNESHTITRTRGTVHLRSPCLSMLLVVTPNTARRHLEDRSLLETGFLGRLLLCDPKAEMSEGSFEEAMSTRRLSSEVSQRYEAAIWKALARYHRPRGLEASCPFEEEEDEPTPPSADGEREPVVVECTVEALRSMWEDSKRQCAAWKEAEQDREMVARENELACRIALVCHIFTSMTFHPSGQGGTWKVGECRGHEIQLAEQTMRDALRIRDWFKASLAAMTSHQKATARDEAFFRLEGLALRYHWEESGITARELQTHGFAKNAEAARKLLEGWAGEGKLERRHRAPKGTGRRPGDAYFLKTTPKATGKRPSL